MTESITDELRDSKPDKTSCKDGRLYVTFSQQRINDYLDRIDEAHEKALDAERRHVLVEELADGAEQRGLM